MRQVFWNILLNAVESIEGTGNILVQAKCEPPMFYVIVSDDGKGIASDNLGRIFEPFHTTKARGTGLGLSIVKRIIEDHGWKITVESQENRGTRFTLTIPQRQDERFP
jgi:signal transduction histidine kinase